jgi:hypothetical protein
VSFNVTFQFPFFNLIIKDNSMINTFKSIICYIAIVGLMAGCATAGKDVVATYVSPVQYSNYDCEQLRAELIRINSRVNQMTGRLDTAASNDAAIMGVGMILFWPALFALGGTKQQEAELSRLKGEYEALQSAASGKKCQ